MDSRVPIYLDHNASTPTDPRVVAAMQPYFTDLYANPSSVEHPFGAAAAAAVEEARATVAETIGARPKEIIFTSGCTEANNIAILGVMRGADKTPRRHAVTTRIEHPSVLACFQQLETEGVEVTYVSPDTFGRVPAHAVEAAIRSDTALVSIMAANNETGAIQPFNTIGAACEKVGAVLHVDFAQASAYVRLDVETSHIHLASFSAHKAYGPKGVGVLYVRNRAPRPKLAPIFFGGGQERGLRSGTLNTPGIVGMGAAFKLIQEQRDNDAKRIRLLRDRLAEGILTNIPGAMVNADLRHSLPNTMSISIDGIQPLALMHTLRNRIVFSASSACATEKASVSHVLEAMFGDTPRAKAAFRLGLGRGTTEADADAALAALTEGVSQLRSRRLGAKRPQVTKAG